MAAGHAYSPFNGDRGFFPVAGMDRYHRAVIRIDLPEMAFEGTARAYAVIQAYIFRSLVVEETVRYIF